MNQQQLIRALHPTAFVPPPSASGFWRRVSLSLGGGAQLGCVCYNKSMNNKLSITAIVGFYICIASPVWSQPYSLKETNSRGAFTSETSKRPLGRVEAFIGRRASMRSGERSSLKWLSRLIKQRPKANHYIVEWYVRDKGKWWNVATTFEPKGDLQFVAARSSVAENPSFSDRSWPVNVDQIHKAARRNATFKVFGIGQEM